MSNESSKTDLMYEITYNPKFVPRRSSKVNIKTITIDGENRYFMKNHENGSLYDLSEFGNDLWNLIDGKRTIKQINKELAETYRNLKPSLVQESFLYYANEGLLEAVLEPEKKKRVNIISAFMVRVSLIWESTDFIRSIHGKVRPVLKKWLLWPTIIFSSVMVLLFAGNFISIFTHKENFEIMGSTVIGFFFYYFIVLAPVIAIHEIAHGLALVHYGGAPREMGTGLYFFGPMFYIDVTDGWTLNRYERIMVYAAGPISEVLIGSVILAVQCLWPIPAPMSHILTMTVFYCFWGLLIDVSPLLETDGYNIMCDVLKIPDLRERSFTYLKTAVLGLFKKNVKKEKKAPNSKIKAIFLIYMALASLWAVYLIFRSLTVVTYMSQDTAASVINISSSIVLNQPVTAATILLSIGSVLYLSMVMSGYGLMIFMALKKAVKKTLQFEEIHDRDLSVFLYLPKQVSQSLFTSLRKNMAKVSKGFTRNFSVRQVGSMCVAVLRMGSAKLAFVQTKQHFQGIEKKFDAMYTRFLRHNKNAILGSVGIHARQKTSLPVLLSEMGKQGAKSGIPEAQSVVSQAFSKQGKNALCLLHSVYAKVWTVELPPNLLHEVGQSLLPTFLVEDLSITDLYDDVEDFKKRTVYGFDSLAKLSIENEKELQEALANPEKYHVISSFEPIKGRIIFVGRTEQIEKTIDSLGDLFVCQTWCGYLDNLLSETNLSFLALNRSSLPTAKSVRSIKDGELAVLNRNLSSLISYENLLSDSLRDLNGNCECANHELQELRTRLEHVDSFRTGLINATLNMNTENLAHLPVQFESFRTLSKEIYTKIKRIDKTVKKEIEKRKPKKEKEKRARLAFSPFFLALSAILAFLGLWMLSGYFTIMFLASSALLQLLYWVSYFLLLRSLDTIGKYPSLAFRQIHFFAFAFTESIYALISSANVLTPMKSSSSGSQAKMQNIKK